MRHMMVQSMCLCAMPHRGTYLNLLLRMSTLKSVCRAAVLYARAIRLSTVLYRRPPFPSSGSSTQKTGAGRQGTRMSCVVFAEMPMMAVCLSRDVYYVGVGLLRRSMSR
jgi:hypothetical protein